MIIAGEVTTSVNNLDTATRQQCLTRDWPVSADRAHRDFCHTYGYYSP